MSQQVLRGRAVQAGPARAAVRSGLALPLYGVFRLAMVGCSVLFAAVPFLYLILNSLKLPLEFLADPPRLLPTALTLEHYQALLAPGADTLRTLGNSLVVTAATTSIAVFAGSLAAYSLAHLRVPLGLTTILAFAILGVRFYPKVTIVIPYFALMRDLGLLDSLLALIIAHVSLTLPLVVWLMRAFFEDVPKELDESAVIDGCDPWQRFWLVALPLVIPGVVTVAILTAMVSWNEFLVASSLASLQAKTLPIAISSFVTDKGVLWGPMSAMGVLIVLPPLLFARFAQRYLVRGLTLGAVKGG